MNEEIDIITETAKESMKLSLQHLEKELLNIRAGKANPIMLNSVFVEYYGTPTPLSQVANINTPDGRTLSIQPWEKSLLAEIEKGILQANLGFNPMNNGESLIINIPPLTEERRKELVKLAKVETENAKVGIRNARKEANNDIKKTDSSEDLQKNAEIDIQELTNQFIKKVDDIFDVKEKEILTV
ncbi:MAG: ribosome recycling factor [Flavobacteriaceae bacterium]|nr:ribosome recycling factor [Flavobacteriaceae bacterium]